MTGQLDVLSIGRGHLTLTVDDSNEMEVDKARRIIGDMLRRGYSIFVQGDDGKLTKVKGFDAKHLTYLVDDSMDVEPATGPAPEITPVRKSRGRPRGSTKAIPVTSAKVTVVGRSAGGSEPGGEFVSVALLSRMARP